MEFLADYGYLGMFVSAFLAATILPVGSEIVLVVLLSHDFHPVITVGVATVGNVLGSVVNYFLGLLGNTIVLQKVLGISEKALEKAENRFKRYGVYSLLLAWLPVVGDPLTVVAGIFKIRLDLFVVLVGIGKCLRYVVLAGAVLMSG